MSGEGRGAGREEDYTVAITIRGRQRGGGCRVSGVGGRAGRVATYRGHSSSRSWRQHCVVLTTDCRLVA